LDLRDYARVLRKRWLLIVACTLLGVIVGGGLAMLTTPKYESTTQLYVAVRTSSDQGASDLVQGTTFARQAVVSYVDVVTSAIVLDEVASELGIDATAAQLKNDVRAESPTDSVLINITASGTDPQEVTDLANTTGTVFADTVATEIEIPDASGVSRVQIITIQPATVPTDPVTPNYPINIGLGLTLGLLVGIALAVLREVNDNRIHSPKDVQRATNAPVLGGINTDPEAKQRPLIVHAEPRNPRAERYRTLRTNLQFVTPDEGSKIFVVTSAVPGEGKSVTTANLAIALAEAGARVVLVDGDLRRPRIADYMGIEGAVGLTDVLIGNAELDDVVQPWGSSDLRVLPAGRIPPNPSELLGSEAMASVLRELAIDADYVLIDSSPLLLVTDAAVAAQHANGVVLVAAAGSTKRLELTGAVQALDRAGSKLLGVVLTKMPLKGLAGGAYGAYGSAQAYGDPAAPLPDAKEPTDPKPTESRPASARRPSAGTAADEPADAGATASTER
jgi:capsular exopolysaccharide synthesis family protein